MDIFEARKRNAIREAERINKYISEGYLVVDFSEGDTDILTEPFRIEESGDWQGIKQGTGYGSASISSGMTACGQILRRPRSDFEL